MRDNKKDDEYNFLIDSVKLVETQEIIIRISLFPFTWKLEEKGELKVEEVKIKKYDDKITVLEGAEINKCMI